MDLTLARALFTKLSTTQICDIYPQARVLSAEIRPYSQNAKCLGRALTVQAEGDLLPVLKSLELATKDNIIVIDAGTHFAVVGEIMASEAKRKQIAGMVIDGYCRDINPIHAIGFPLYAKGHCPKAGSKSKPGKLNVAISCSGVNVLPGDIVLCDEDGIVLINESDLENTLQLAQNVGIREKIILDKINNGISLMDQTNFSEHYNNISAGKDSEFKWNN